MVYQHSQLKFIVCPQATHYDSPQKPLYKILILAFTIIWLSIPIIFIMFMHDITIRLAHVDQTMTQTHHAPTSFIFHLSSRCKLSSIATSVLSLKTISSFSHSDFSLSIRIIFQHSLSEQLLTSFILVAIGLPLFLLL